MNNQKKRSNECSDMQIEVESYEKYICLIYYE